MQNELAQAVLTFMKELQQVPGTQLQTIESTLYQLHKDLKEAVDVPFSCVIMTRLKDYITEAGVAKAETAAMLKDCEGPKEDWSDTMSEEDQEAYEAWEAHMNECEGADLI